MENWNQEQPLKNDYFHRLHIKGQGSQGPRKWTGIDASSTDIDALSADVAASRAILPCCVPISSH